jgi:hypothetical protein
MDGTLAEVVVVVESGSAKKLSTWHLKVLLCIRELGLDSLCKDDMDEISRDPH